MILGQTPAFKNVYTIYCLKNLHDTKATRDCNFSLSTAYAYLLNRWLLFRLFDNSCIFSSPVNTSGVVARTETCEEPLVKTEASSSPSDTIGDFPHPSQILANQLHTQQPNAQSGGNFCNLGSPTNQVELGGYPLLSATADIKWYSDFGCSGPNSMGPQGAHGAEKLPIASSPPSTSSEKSLPSFQDSSPYAAYTK